MGGYWKYDEYEGKGIHRMYERPWVVRGKINGEGVTVAAFATLGEAESFVAAGAGHWGRDNVTISNWNE